MSTTLGRSSFIGLLAIITLCALTAIPTRAHAVGTAADAMCTGDPAEAWPTDANKNGVIGVIGKPCQDTTSNFVTAGACVTVQKCQGKTGGGSPLGDPKQLMDMAKSLMDIIKGMGGGGGGSGSGAGATPAASTPGCATYYQVSVPTSDPCAIYQPTTSSSIDPTLPLNTSSDLLNALTGGTNTNSVSSILDLSGTATTTTTTTSTTPAPATSTVPVPTGNAVGLTPGVSGDIRTVNGGATVIINNKNTEANTEVAGFYGSDTAGSQQPQGLVAGMCQARPWSTNFLNFIIPPSFFDSICALRGYQVGKPQAAAKPVVRTVTTAPKPVVKPATTTVTSPAEPVGPVIPPEANIWAVPTSVPLGARTTIFWSTKGVKDCTVSSPDGSFNQTTLSGGAATVPLSGPTTYTISCNTPAGGHITNFTTVGLSN